MSDTIDEAVLIAMPGNHDEVRCFYELPAVLVRVVREAAGGGGPSDTFAFDIALATTLGRLQDAERERDQAVAHDRQPYPTAWAYEQACKALGEAKDEIRQLRGEA